MRKPRAKTTTEAELRRLADEGKTWVEVAELLGISVVDIRIAASVLGIGRKFKHEDKTWRDSPEVQGRRERRARVLELGKQGMHYRQIADEVGISRIGVYHYLNRHGITPTTNRAPK